MKISVCIATYNGEKYIDEQLMSILSQLEDDDEVIISDDSSVDHTIRLINNIGDRRVIILSNQRFGNPIFNFENAIKHASGDLIFLSDQDDIWLDNKVSTMKAKFEEGYDLVVSNAIIGDAKLETVKDSYFEWRNSRSGLVKNLIKNSYLGCCMAFRKDLLIKILPFPKNIPMHDMWIGVIAEVYFKPVFIKDKLMIYRRHGENATVLTNDFKSNDSIYTKILYRIRLLSALVKRMILNK
jgi:glycosyltransferase involved in cell wall biosynthesis